MLPANSCKPFRSVLADQNTTQGSKTIAIFLVDEQYSGRPIIPVP